MTYRVVFTDPAQHTFEAELVGRLSRIDARFELTSNDDEATLMRECRTADAIITSAALISRNVIEQLERCRVIARAGTGYDNVDYVAAATRGIPVTNVPEFCTEDVATHTLTMILGLLRRVVVLDGQIRCGIWDQNNVLPTERMSKMTLGIIGFGSIGRAVAVRAAAFGMQIVYYDILNVHERRSPLATRCQSLEELFQKSDVVSAHLPLTPNTRGLLDRTTFKCMKPTAVLINTARGAIVNERDLIDALESRTIAGAALDVLEHEPPDPANPLLSMSNVLLTPHCASHSNDSLSELRSRTIEEVIRALRGEKLLHVVNGVDSTSRAAHATRAAT